MTSYTIFSQNLEYGGMRDANGISADRWSGHIEVIKAVRPDILLLQEVAPEWWNVMRYQFGAERALGMRALVAPSSSGFHTAVMFRTDVFEPLHWETKYASTTLHGFGVAVLGAPDLPVPLTVISGHLDPASVEAAATEAQRMIQRVYRYGGVGVIGGDINHYGLHDAEPDWDRQKPNTRSARAVLSADGTLRANRIVAEKFAVACMTDAAAHFATAHGRRSLPEPTTRGGSRADQFHVTPPLVTALVSYRTVPNPHSDHDGILVEIDPAEINHSALTMPTRSHETA